MEICYEPSAGEAGPERRERGQDATRWQELRGQLESLRENVDSEWTAVITALSGHGPAPVRKWLGWALYRVAARVNPEIRD